MRKITSILMLFTFLLGFGLAKAEGAIPEVGKNYYFANKHLAGDQYFYDNAGQVGFGAQKMDHQKKYVWTCEDAGNGHFYFKNLATNNYFAWKSLSTSACEWALSTATEGNARVTNEGCVSMQAVNQGGSNYMVCVKGGFDQARNAGFYDDKYSSDFRFELCTNTQWEETEEPEAPVSYYSVNYGDNWVRLVWDRNTNDAAGLVSTTGNFKNMAAKSNPGDMTSKDQLWSLVGDEKGFIIQNALAGEDLALHVSSTSEGAEAKLVAKGSACKWVLVDKGGSFAIAPAKNKDMSLNSFGGARKNLKLYNANDGGSKWKLQSNLVEGIKMTTIIDGQNPYGDKRVVAGTLKFAINGVVSSSSVFTDASGESTYYLPSKAKVVLTQADGGRGFAKGGFEVDGKSAEKVEFTVGESVANVKVVFKASVENGVVLYFTPDAKGFPYRIPAIATAKNGDIFAISDNRPAGADIGYGEVDIKCRISKDDGQSWGEEFFIADGHGRANAANNGPWDYGFGDAAVVADRERNELLVMMVCGKTVCWNGNYDPKDPKKVPNRVAQVRAKLNEATGEWEWTKPVEVTETIYPLFVKNGKATVQSLFIGSGRICQSRVTKVGDYYRLYCATWTKNEGNRVIYSDDFGQSWHILGTVDDRPGRGGDEPKCEEMPNGNVVLSSRRNGRLFNIFTYSDVEKGEGKWQTEEWSDTREGGIKVGNSTNGEIMMLKAVRMSDGQKVDLALQSVPFGGGRSDVGFFFKEIGEKEQKSALELSKYWTKGLQVSHVGSAYSTMALQHDRKIGFFFEEEPGNYCMVYIPLTVEQITKGEYALDEASYPTGIGELVADPLCYSSFIYDLNGCRVINPQKGVYIVNGKKVYFK